MCVFLLFPVPHARAPSPAPAGASPGIRSAGGHTPASLCADPDVPEGVREVALGLLLSASPPPAPPPPAPAPATTAHVMAKAPVRKMVVKLKK